MSGGRRGGVGYYYNINILDVSKVTKNVISKMLLKSINECV